MKPRRPTVKDSTQNLRSEGRKRKAQQVAARAARKAAAKRAKLEAQLCETVGMEKQTTRTPKVGDIVGIAEQPGTFVVAGVNHNQKFVNLDKIGSQGKGVPNVPWSRLTYHDELDESQNALRVCWRQVKPQLHGRRSDLPQHNRRCGGALPPQAASHRRASGRSGVRTSPIPKILC